MFDLEKWQEIFSAIWKHKLRTIATGFGIFWGIMMLVILLGAGQGLQNGVTKSSILDATNSIWFVPRITSMAYKGMKPGRRYTLKEEDLDFIKRNVKGIEYISPENGVWNGYQVKYNGKAGDFPLIAGAEDYFKIKIYQDYLAGRRINLFDNIESRKVCTIGDKVAEVLFGDEDPIGKFISIADINFKIIGLFHDDGYNGQFSERIYIPFSTYQATFNPNDDVSLFAVTTLPGYDPRTVESEIEQYLRQKYFIHPDDRQALLIHNQQDQFNQMQNVFLGIKVIIWIVSIGTLIAGIMGVSNIMIIVVKERTKEIGVRKALGATPGSIVSLILSEALFITSIAGYIGLLAGLSLVEGLNYILSINNAENEYFTDPNVNVRVAVAAMFVLIISGIIAGWVPARQAARLRPVQALKDE